jgi:protein gp37
MGSDIEWTDETWNPFRGCVKISPGCKHCYAETFAERFRGIPGHPYERGFEPRVVLDQFDRPLRWKRPRRVFVNSMSDLFLADFTDEQITDVFGVMETACWHVYQILTKRAERMRELVTAWANAWRGYAGRFGHVQLPMLDGRQWAEFPT